MEKLLRLLIHKVFFVSFFITLLFPYVSFAQQAITFGETISASIGSAGEEDSYTFEAETGDVIRIVVTTQSFLDPYVHLYGPGGALLKVAVGFGPCAVDLDSGPLPSEGTFAITVSDHTNTPGETGSYNIYVQRVNNSTGAVAIDGETLSGRIDIMGKADTYTIEADAGDVIRIVVTTKSALDPTIRLYESDGTFLKTSTGFGPCTADLDSDPLPSGGTYTIIVGDHGNTPGETGVYSIFVQRVNNPTNAVAIDGETLSGDIDMMGEADTYTIEAEAGDIIRIVATTASSLDPYVRLYGPDGAFLKYAVGFGPATAELDSEPLPIGGTCTIFLADHSNTPGETGGYEIFSQNYYSSITYIYLQPGFNLINIPTDISGNTELKDWVSTFGVAAEIEKVMAYDVAQNRFVAVIPESPTNPEYTLDGTEGLIVYSNVAKIVTFDSVHCQTLNLSPGFNSVGFACVPKDYNAHDFLEALGSENVSSIQKYDTVKGMFETASFRDNGQLAGVDFTIRRGEGYFVYMQKAVLGFSY